MKVVILAGGLGTRLSEETTLRPKPMVEIGGKPLLWHIMNVYAAHGYDEFIVALGYKGDFVKEYFLNFYAVNNDLTIEVSKGKTVVHDGRQPRWTVHLVDTGLNTQTGGRVARLRSWIGNETFMLTYGDGLSDVDVKKLVEFHKSHGKLATVTAVRPPARFGELMCDDEKRVVGFAEKPQLGEGFINGGFFVLEPKVLDYISGDQTPWEGEPMQRLVRECELVAYQHEGFWQPMDTMREKIQLDSLWESGKAPWKVWQ